MKGHPLCPACALQDYLRLSRAALPLQPLFVNSSLTPVTYNSFLKRLRAFLQSCGLNPAEFSGHSFRRGGATWAFKSGLSEQVIQKLGYWSSSAFLRYIDSDSNQQMQAVQQMVTSI